jgi:hypothetical protein
VLSPSIVRDLGATFCSVDPSNLSDDKLNAKPLKQRVVNKPRNKKPTLKNTSEAGPSKIAKSPTKKSKKSSKNLASSKKDKNASP